MDNPEPYGKQASDFIKKPANRQKEPAWIEWKKKKDEYEYQQWEEFDPYNKLDKLEQ